MTFRVAAHPSTPDERELQNATHDPLLKTLRRFEARPGINTLVADSLNRYQSALGVSGSVLVPIGVSRPNPLRSTQLLVSYQQYYLGYPIAGFGYLVATENGMFRSADGRVTNSLPATLPTPISASAALQAALSSQHITSQPWLTNPSKFHAPVTTLILEPMTPRPATASDFRLVWDVQLIGTGVTGTGRVGIDAGTSAVAYVQPASVSFTALDPEATFVTTTTNTVKL